MRYKLSRVVILGMLLAGIAIPASALAYSSSTFSIKKPAGWTIQNFHSPGEVAGFGDGKVGIAYILVRKAFLSITTTASAKAFIKAEQKDSTLAIVYGGKTAVNGNTAWYANTKKSANPQQRMLFLTRGSKLYVILVIARNNVGVEKMTSDIISNWHWH